MYLIVYCFFQYFYAQSLHAISGTAHAYAKTLGEKGEGTIPYRMREKSCPKEFTDILDNGTY